VLIEFYILIEYQLKLNPIFVKLNSAIKFLN
jgi:hypothetical protein